MNMIFSQQNQQKNIFVSQVKALNKGQVANTQLIWKAFQGPKSQQNISYFCLQLFQHVLNSQKKFYLQINQERSYATLFCLQVLKNKKQKTLQSLEDCRRFIEKKGPSHGKNLLQFLMRNQRTGGIVQFFISRLVMAPLQINWNQDLAQQLQKQVKQAQSYQTKIKALNPYKNYQILKHQSFAKSKQPQTKLLTFAYICFTQYLRNNNNIISQKQYTHLKNVTKFLMNAAKSVPVAEQYLKKILHLIVKCVTFYGCQYEEVLKDLLVLVEKLRQFGGVVGEFAGDIFSILMQEAKIPGYAFRKKLRKDFPSIDIKQTIFLNKQIYLITDQQDLYGRQQEHSLTTLRKLIILHYLKVSKMPQKHIQLINQYLKYINENATYLLYEKITKIVELLDKLNDINKVKEIFKSSLLKVFQQVLSDNNTNIDLNSSKQDRSGLNRKNQKFSADSIQVEQFNIYSKKINQFGYFQYPKYEIISVPINDFISENQNVLSLKRILKKHKADYSTKPYLTIKIPIVFNGDGQNFHKFLTKMVQYQQNTPIQQAKKFQIFHLPKHQNTCRVGIGKFIASHDPWYKKFIFNVHQERMLYPHLEVNQDNKDLFPFWLYSRNLQLYLRQANYTLPMRVYQCTMTMNQTNEEKKVYMISFFMMGLFCEAKIIKMQKQREKGKQQRYQNKQLIEIIEQKIKKVHIMTVSIQVQSIQPFTNQLRIKKQKNIRIEDIQICNLSCDYFMGKQPNCTSVYLQMSILTQNNGRIFRKQVGRSENFKENKQLNEIFLAFYDLFICRTIRRFVIQSQDTKNGMKFMIDGMVYHKVNKLKIQPMFSVDSIPIALPIQIFFPFT